VLASVLTDPTGTSLLSAARPIHRPWKLAPLAETIHPAMSTSCLGRRVPWVVDIPSRVALVGSLRQVPPWEATSLDRSRSYGPCRHLCPLGPV
jgi:hypothetical protein